VCLDGDTSRSLHEGYYLCLSELALDPDMRCQLDSAIAFVMLLGVEGGYSSENALAMLTQVKARAIAFLSLKSTEKR